VKYRPQITVILAMTADGKITDRNGSAAHFGSTIDRTHLETQIALADGVLFGAGTLRAYGTSLPITNPELLQLRMAAGQTTQPFHIVASASGKLDRSLKFFTQPLPRWLLTTSQGTAIWQGTSYFDRLLIADTANDFEWKQVLSQLFDLGINKLAVLGGGSLVASLFRINVIDELWLTVCPLILGGKDATTPVEGEGWLQSQGKRLSLLEVKQIDREVFLHYRVKQ
jgi:5-amino-6-(5-phosphoribosylamino)uracil reductase